MKALGEGLPKASQPSPEPPSGLCPQLRALPTYQVMLSAAHELPEGSLVFLTDRQELYARLRGGFRRVLVSGVELEGHHLTLGESRWHGPGVLVVSSGNAWGVPTTPA